MYIICLQLTQVYDGHAHVSFQVFASASKVAMYRLNIWFTNSSIESLSAVRYASKSALVNGGKLSGWNNAVCFFASDDVFGLRKMPNISAHVIRNCYVSLEWLFALNVLSWFLFNNGHQINFQLVEFGYLPMCTILLQVEIPILYNVVYFDQPYRKHHWTI